MPPETKRSKEQGQKLKRSKEQKKVILEQGAEIFQTKKEHGIGNRARSKEKLKRSKEKGEKEQAGKK